MIVMAQTLKSFETRIRPKPPEKETIHSGHFMVSKFEAEEPDDDDDVAVPVPDAMLNKANMNLQAVQSVTTVCSSTCKIPNIPGQSIAIETSLAKLFQCMSLAYRQKLTSPKWNRFKGIKLRWKDKIRLNNVIWRCWHMQFITKKNSLVCQFASPLDVDTHNKPEAVVLEGKYWKRKLNAVTAEYKKWRMFYRNQLLGWAPRDCQDMLSEMDFLDWQPHSNDSNMMVDEDYMEFMSDTLFSSISAQPFAFPDPREIARGAGLWADLIQPSLVQLQPNLDDDVMDTLEPLHDLLCSKLPPVPEEVTSGTASDSSIQDLYRALNGTYQEMTSDPSPPPPPLPSPKPLAGRQQNTSIYRPVKQEPQYTSYQYAAQSTRSSTAYKPFTSLMPLTYGMAPNQQPVAQYQQLSPPPPPPPLPPPPPPQPTNIQSQPSPPEFKLPSTPPPPTPQSAASSYPMTAMQRANMRSNSLPLGDKPMPQRRATEEVFAIPKLKHRNRSRSGSCLITPGKTSTPTLISAGSDPALNTSQTPNALLHQLLTTNNSNNCNTASNYSYRPVTASNAMMDKNQGCMTDAGLASLPAGSMDQSVASYSGYSQSQNASAVHNINTDSNDGVDFMPDNATVMYASHSPSDTFTFSANMSSAGLSRRMGKTQPLTTILSQPAATALVVNAPSPLSISAQHSPQMVGSASNSPKHPDSPGNDSLSLSPLNVGSPNSPNSKTGRRTYKEHRRVCHINAEQKRRCTIKNGFDTLHALIPQLNQNPNAKLSKAAMLQKGAEYIRQLRNERNQLKEEMDSLRQQVECLNSAISNCQSMLPATGAPVSRHRTSRMKEMYNDYIRSRTQENWRFWLLSLICEPLLVSFNNTVSTASLDDLYRTTLIWVEQHCSLVDLRPVVLNALRHLCTSTDFLSDPTKLPSEAQAAAIKSHSSNS